MSEINSHHVVSENLLPILKFVLIEPIRLCAKTRLVSVSPQISSSFFEVSQMVLIVLDFFPDLEPRRISDVRLTGKVRVHIARIIGRNNPLILRIHLDVGRLFVSFGSHIDINID